MKATSSSPAAGRSHSEDTGIRLRSHSHSGAASEHQCEHKAFPCHSSALQLQHLPALLWQELLEPA